MRHLFIFIFLIFVVTNVNANPYPPLIAQEFYSTINFTLYDAPPLPGDMFYSASAKAYITTMLQDMGDGFINNVTTLVLKNEAWLFVSGQCKPWFGNYSIGLFDWVFFANYDGKIDYNGQTCDSWSFNITGTYMSLYNVGNVPVRLYADILAVNNVNSSEVICSWDFIDFQPQTVNSSVFKTPEQCLGDGILCPGGSIEIMDFYFYHPTNDYSIENNNVADLLGDTSFVCFDGFDGSYQLVSLVRVQVNTTWGSYALCNFNVCQTLNPLTVGREGAFGVGGPDSGQCSNNSVTGSWYSFTTESNCDNPNAESCAWKEIGILKTVTADCLIQNGFQDACVADGGFPYSSAAEIFNNAFEYDDPSQGGCPSVSQLDGSPLEIQLLRDRHSHFHDWEYSLPVLSTFTPDQI